MDHKHNSWLRPFAIALAVFIGWAAISVLFYSERPDDPPIIVSLLSQ
jgi:hypothetical protein